MPQVKARALREKSIEELRTQEQNLREQIFKLRFQRATGQADNTLVVYAGDNGYFWGEHGFTDVGGMLAMNDLPEFTYRYRKDQGLRGYDWWDFVGDEEEDVGLLGSLRAKRCCARRHRAYRSAASQEIPPAEYLLHLTAYKWYRQYRCFPHVLYGRNGEHRNPNPEEVQS